MVVPNGWEGLLERFAPKARLEQENRKVDAIDAVMAREWLSIAVKSAEDRDYDGFWDKWDAFYEAIQERERTSASIAVALSSTAAAAVEMSFCQEFKSAIKKVIQAGLRYFRILMRILFYIAIVIAIITIIVAASTVDSTKAPTRARTKHKKMKKGAQQWK
jgi:hypothetical protein